MTDPRERVTTGAVWESQVGYCRAVRSGDYICVSGTAHAEAFGAHPPATTMVQVAALIDPEMLIEIEAEAILPSP